MGQVSEYKVVRAAIDNGELEEVVNQFIEQGWQPLGGIHCSGDEPSIATQALVRFGSTDGLLRALQVLEVTPRGGIKARR